MWRRKQCPEGTGPDIVDLATAGASREKLRFIIIGKMADNRCCCWSRGESRLNGFSLYLPGISAGCSVQGSSCLTLQPIERSVSTIRSEDPHS